MSNLRHLLLPGALAFTLGLAGCQTTPGDEAEGQADPRTADRAEAAADRAEAAADRAEAAARDVENAVERVERKLDEVSYK